MRKADESQHLLKLAHREGQGPITGIELRVMNQRSERVRRTVPMNNAFSASTPREVAPDCTEK